MTSKQRAYLKSLAMKMDPIMQLGKGSVTPENTASVDEALAARELIKNSLGWTKYGLCLLAIRLINVTAPAVQPMSKELPW